jgi:hypothetical protein
MPNPGRNENAEPQVGPGHEPSQPTPLDEFISELSEANAGLVVPETRSG